MTQSVNIQYGFANAIMAKTIGGLVICGMNEGLNLRFAATPGGCQSLRLANVSHPNFKVAYQDVADSATAMRPWLDDVLANYRSIQAAI
jgi:hypothetical protein